MRDHRGSQDCGKSASHITGGGLLDNLPRVFPEGVSAEIDLGSWVPEAIFRFLTEKGGLTREDAYQTFNMGIGMCVIASPEAAATLLGLWPDAVPIGRMVPGEGAVLLR